MGHHPQAYQMSSWILIKKRIWMDIIHLEFNVHYDFMVSWILILVIHPTFIEY